MASYRHQQRKQHLFQLDAGLLEDLLVAQRWFITLMISSSAP